MAHLQRIADGVDGMKSERDSAETNDGSPESGVRSPESLHRDGPGYRFWQRMTLALSVLFVALSMLTGWLWSRASRSSAAVAGAAPPAQSPAPAAQPQHAAAAPAPKLSATAKSYVKFIQRDDKRGGKWKQDLGQDGYFILNQHGGGLHEQRLPDYVSELSVNGELHIWARNDDPRGLEDPGTSAVRLSACAYSDSAIRLNIGLERPAAYRLALYALDFDKGGRKQKIELLQNDEVLDTQQADDLSGGLWLHYEVSGPVVVRLTNTGSSNAVLAGVFFDSVGPQALKRAPPQGPIPGEDKLKAGLWAEYFDGLKAYPQENHKPALARAATSLSFGSVRENQLSGWPFLGHCAAIFSGFVKVPQDGAYVFFSESDDGSMLYVDGKLLVDNDGTHGMQEKSGSLELKAGLHRVWIAYFNAGAGMGLNVSAQATGGAKEPLKALFHDPAERGK